MVQQLTDWGLRSQLAVPLRLPKILQRPEKPGHQTRPGEHSVGSHLRQDGGGQTLFG